VGAIIAALERQPWRSLDIAPEFGLSQARIIEVLRDSHLDPYHLRRIENIKSDNSPVRLQIYE